MAYRLLLSVGTTLTLGLVGGACGQDASESAGDRGAALYGANCASCHGGDLQGSSLGPSLLDAANAPDQLDDAGIRLAVRNGVEDPVGDYGAMPANAVLRDVQIDEIVAFIRSEQAAASTAGGVGTEPAD